MWPTSSRQPAATRPPSARLPALGTQVVQGSGTAAGHALSRLSRLSRLSLSVPWAPGQLWPAQGIAERISKQDINTVTGQAGSLQSLRLCESESV